MEPATAPLAGLRASGHLCFPYESEDERRRVLVAFVREGLERRDRCVYIGLPDEQSDFLDALGDAGVDTQRAVLAAFALSGGLSAFGGILLAGYASKAAQAMGDPYLLPSIAAVVLGGTSILGGHGSYSGTVAGVILITLLQSILAVMQIPEAGRQVIYGVVIVAMLLLYGRERLLR